MVFSLETAKSSRVVLLTILVHSVYGTFFPPVSNPRPIPAQGVRTLDNGSPGFYVQDGLSQDFAPPPLVRDEGLFAPDVKPDDQRWYIQENQSEESDPFSRSIETFDRYYQSGEPAIGPVATPIPDDAYIAQSSSISRLNPNDPGNSEVWILTRGSESQYIPDRWVQVQVPSERVVEVINQDSGPPPVATDPVKSVIAPVPPEVPVKTQFTANSPANVVQQIWVQSPNVADARTYGKSATIIEEIPSVKQIFDIPPGNGKQIVQQQVIKDAPPPINVPPPAPVLQNQYNTKTFSLPPPLPPPLKGDVTSKSISPANVIPDTNVIIGSKNSVYQRLRHVWIPTSSNTGKFISFPVSANIDSGKSVVNTDLSLAPTPITVSDTWVLKQDGPLTGFQQQKSALPPPPIQSGKVIIQDPSGFQINNPPSPKIVAQIASPKTPVGNGVIGNAPAGLWPVRKDLRSIVSDKSTAVVVPDSPISSIKSDAIGISKGLPLLPIAPQKTLTKSAIPPPVPPPSVQVINGKPCPLPPPVPQKAFFPPPSPPIISVPRVIGNSRLPLTRIIRVNRYPTGSYYLLNSRIRPNYYNYPNPAFIQQQKPGIIRLVQPKQIPVQFQGKQPIIPAQAKRIAIPVQSKQFVAPVPARQVAFPLFSRQAIIPQKSTRIIYPTVQAIRYPWSGLANYRPVPGKGIILPQFSPLKAFIPASDSSSSENSSESSSSNSSESKEKKAEKKKKEEKEEKPKEEKSKEEKPKEEKEEKPESGESSSPSEGEKESSSVEKESEENTSESKIEEESIEAAESQIFHVPANMAVLESFDHLLNPESEVRVTASHGHNLPENEPHHDAESRTVSHESTHSNDISSRLALQHGETHHALEGSTDNLTTEFDRD